MEAPGEAESGSGQGKQKMREIPGKYTVKEKGKLQVQWVEQTWN